MPFLSITFALFFGLFTAAVWITPRPYRWASILTGSAIFVGLSSPAALAVLASASAWTYWIGRTIGRAPSRGARLLRLAVGAAALVLLLVAARVIAFSGSDPVTALPGVGGNLIWDLGLSFYGLKAIGYILDVYFARVEPEQSFGQLAAYLSFLAEIPSGPIDRPGSLLRQIGNPTAIDSIAVREGLRRILVGWIKKALIADRLKPFVALAFAEPGHQSDPVLLLAVAAFAAQLYFDFSGYTDIALGLGRIVGFSLPENFAQPYFARSISDFWRRWHISLSSWLRDYLFLPAYYSIARAFETGNRSGAWGDRLAFSAAALATMAVAGAWHGLALNYFLWAFCFAAAMIASVLLAGPRKRLVRWSGLRKRPGLHAALKTANTLGIVLVGWTLLRAESLAGAAHILGAPFRIVASVATSASAAAASAAAWRHEAPSVAAALTLAAGFIVVDWAVLKGRDPGKAFLRLPVWIRWTCYYAALGALVFFSRPGSGAFIYAGF